MSKGTTPGLDRSRTQGLLWRRCVAAALVAAIACTTETSLAAVQEGRRTVEAQIEAIETARAEAVRSGLSAAERRRARDRAIELRAALIEDADARADWRAATWMMDQAADLMERLRASGTEASVLLGVPTPQQRAEADRDARRALELTALADDAVRRAVARLESQLFEQGRARGAGDTGGSIDAAEVERRMGRLIDTERELRIPYFRGRAAAVLAAIEPARAAKEEFARSSLESIGQLVLGTTGAEATRRLTLAAVLLTIFPDEEEPRAQAKELLTWVLAKPVVAGDGAENGGGAGTDAVDPITHASAWMGFAALARGDEERRAVVNELERSMRSFPFRVSGADGGGDPLLALLVAEGRTAALLREASRTPLRRTELLKAAFSPLAALLTREDLAGHRDALRPVVLAKLAAASDPAMPLSEVDPHVMLARAAAAAAEGTPRSKLEALRMFAELADRPDAGDLRAEALWEYAVLAWETAAPAGDTGFDAERAIRAIEALNMLAGEFPEIPRARDAAVKGVELSRYTLARLASAAGGSPGAERRARVEKLYERALEHAFTLAPDDPDLPALRMERARLALAGADEGLSPERLDEALTALEGVRRGGGDAARDADALAQSAINRALAAAQAAAAGGDDAARQRLLAIARRAVQWAQERKPSAADGYRLALGEALLDGGDGRAAAILSGLSAKKLGPATPEGLRLRVAQARMQRAADSSGAFVALRGIVEEMDTAALAGKPRPPAYWTAWAEMLEILAADNESGKRNGQIRAAFDRLRGIDPQLGGGAVRARILRAAGAG